MIPRAAAWLALPVALLAGGAARAQEGDCRASGAALAAFDGVWMARGLTSGLNGRAVPGQADLAEFFVFSGQSARWNAEGRKRLEAMFAAFPGRKQKGFGYPVMMSSPTPFEIVVGREKTAILGEYRDIRVIYTDGREWDEDAWPTIYGESLGCWQGDTLRIETRGVHFTPEFTAVQPPFTDDAVFVETLSPSGPDTLTLVAMVTDPALLEEPWTTQVTYFRHPLLQRLVIEGALEANDRVVQVDGQYAIVGAEGGLAEDAAGAAGEEKHVD